jgi:hypothetical protein
MSMIVIGLDVHKQSVTAVAVDEAGRPLGETVIPVGSDELLAWAVGSTAERLWAVEDCRQLTGWLERQLLGVGEELVRVPPKLTVPERRAGQHTRQVGPDRRARDRTRGAARAGSEPAARRTSAATGRSSYWSITATTSSTCGAARSNGCAGTCISSTRPSSCRCAALTGPRIWSE